MVLAVARERLTAYDYPHTTASVPAVLWHTPRSIPLRQYQRRYLVRLRAYPCTLLAVLSRTPRSIIPRVSAVAYA
eukprot:1053704-Rhodomonas_salina.4